MFPAQASTTNLSVCLLTGKLTSLWGSGRATVHCGTLLQGYLQKVGKAEQRLLLRALPSIRCSLIFSRLEGCFAEGFVVMWGRFKREDLMKNKCKGLAMRRERLKNY